MFIVLYNIEYTKLLLIKNQLSAIFNYVFLTYNYKVK
jgi:hypothetical protein